ncbi:MAG TPA: GntR family transcriptional regulator [Kaistia sp.]|nr:GntR family transcriptional regulator [Kaistia sp.]
MRRNTAGHAEPDQKAGDRPPVAEPATFATRQPPKNLSALAYVEIARLIEKKELRAGEVVVEQNLAAYLGISRTPVRQALQRLELEGLLVKSNTKSFVVRKVDLKEYLQSLKAREIMESAAAGMCVELAPAERIAAAKATLGRLKVSERYDQEEHWASDREVHDIVADFCGNQVVGNIVKSLRVTTKLFEVERLAERLEPDTRQHEVILDKIEQRDAAGARKAMADHIKSLFQFALDTVA